MAPILILGFCFVTIFFIFFVISIHQKPETSCNLPPGRYGWPVIGETLSYLSCPGDFIRHKMAKHSSNIFRTSLVGQKMVVLCGPSANKFVFSNEDKLVRAWLPASLAKVLSQPSCDTMSTLSSLKQLDELVHKFFRLESIQQHVPVMDSMARDHLDRYWVADEEMRVYPLAKEFAFSVACRILLDYDNSCSKEVSNELTKQFFVLTEGIFTTPVNIPGTTYYKATKGGDVVRDMILGIIKQRRRELIASEDDMLGRLLAGRLANGESFSDEQIAGKIIGYLFGGFYTASSSMTFVISHLAQHPHIFEKVVQEQLEVARERGQGKVMSWVDVQKMKYTWNVVCESMRVLPPTIGTFKEAIVDFTYEGYTVPKGWKVFWTTHSTNKDPNYFPDPEKFDPSRFEGKGPSPFAFVPFGGGPRMCKGNEYARMLILVFLHNVVTRFSLEKVNPNEKIYYSPDPIPAEGARILIRPLVV